MWPQVTDAFQAKNFSEFVTFDNSIVDNKQLLDEKMGATIDGRSELSSGNDSKQENELHAVRLISQQVIDCTEEDKEYSQQRQDDCSIQVLQLAEMRRKVLLPQNPPSKGLPISDPRVLLELNGNKKRLFVFYFGLLLLILCNNVVKHRNQSFGKEAFRYFRNMPQ